MSDAANELSLEILVRRTGALALTVARSGSYQRRQPIASDVDPDSCPRRQVHEIVHHDKRPQTDPELQARFEVGNLWEREGVKMLMDLGFSVIHQQERFELRGRQEGVVLTGKIDGKIEWGKGVNIPFEVKSINPNAYARINSVDDFYTYAWWTRRYPYQMLSYLLGTEHDAGVFLVTDCLGHWKVLPVSLDYMRAERVLAFAESIVRQARLQQETGVWPAYAKDPDECSMCWAKGRVCDPPEPEPEVIDDSELESMLTVWDSLKAEAAMFKKLDAQIKAAVKDKPLVKVGDFRITGKAYSATAYAVPPEVKEEYAIKQERWRTKIERKNTKAAS